MIPLANEEATRQFAAQLSHMLQPGDVIGLAGPLGAGKTTLARGILTGLGYSGDVPSPTFTLVQVYGPPDVPFPIWHCDLYRLEAPEDAEELGLDEALAVSALIIEWPQRLGHRLWPETLLLTIDSMDERRDLTACVPPAWEGRWPPT